MITLFEFFLKHFHTEGNEKHHYEIGESEHKIGYDVIVGRVTELLEGLIKVGYGNEADDRGLLNKNDKLVAEGGKNILYINL